MTFNQAQDEFAVRYYLWANEEARMEVEKDFPILKRMDKARCRKFLRHMAQLSKEDQYVFAALMVKRFHPHALKLMGEPSITADEIAEIKRYNDACVMELDPIEQAFLERELAADSTTRLNRKKFTTIVKTSLLPVLGKPDSWGGGGSWRYQNPIGNLRVDTYFDTGGGHHQLCYSHAVIFSGYQTLTEQTSLLSWLGLSSQTDWNNLEDSKAEPTAKLSAELCAHFLDVAPKLLKGISPE